MASNNTKLPRDVREEILSWVVAGEHGIAHTLARRWGMADNYPEKLARARGLMPRTAKRWAQLRESA